LGLDSQIILLTIKGEIMNNEYILQMKGIKKSFPGVQALNNVSLNVKKGTVHALMGENGAGKSTLMKVLIGIYQADEGEIIFKGNSVTIGNTHNALKLGISMIHQELNPVMEMKVSENIFLGREPISKFTRLVDDKKLYADTMDLFEKTGIMGISPNTKMKELSIAKIQMVEIAKAISYDSDLIIMDEPTSAISESEVETLFNIIRSFKEKGIATIYISHKVDEIFKISDEITVFRDGEYIGTENTSDMTHEKLFSMMVNRDLKDYFVKTRNEIGDDVVLEVKNLTRTGKFKDVSFKLYRGEILGIAGLMGSGRTEIVEAIFGIHPYNSGEIFKDGKKLDITCVRDAIQNKISLATEDRKLYGLFLNLSVKHNISICCLNRFSNKLALVKTKPETDCVKEMATNLRVKTPSINQIVNNLSGGNQQKVVLCKWLLTQPDILILDEPTRGIDVGAKAEIYNIMDTLAKQGKSIIMISSEMPEILGVSDRIIVVRGGQITAEFDKNEATQEKIIKYASVI
jgi:inositol transport system ATP-binding protein